MKKWIPGALTLLSLAAPGAAVGQEAGVTVMAHVGAFASNPNGRWGPGLEFDLAYSPGGLLVHKAGIRAAVPGAWSDVCRISAEVEGCLADLQDPSLFTLFYEPRVQVALGGGGLRLYAGLRGSIARGGWEGFSGGYGVSYGAQVRLGSAAVLEIGGLNERYVIPDHVDQYVGDYGMRGLRLGAGFRF